MKKMVVGLVTIIAIVSILLFISFNSDEGAGEGSTAGEVVVSIDGWRYALYQDGTAAIVGVEKAEYNLTEEIKNGKPVKKTNAKRVVDDIPCYVTVKGIKYTVTELGPELFAGTVKSLNFTTNFSSLRFFTEIYIPNTIEKIGDNCFMQNQWFVNETNQFPDRLTIHFGSKDRSVDEPETSSLREIGSKAFYCCGMLNKVSYKGTEFGVVSGLYSLDLPTSVRVIGIEAFRQCVLLTDINLDGVTEIKDRAFMKCSGLNEVDLSSAEIIRTNAFNSCSELAVKNLSHRCLLENSAFVTSNISFSGNEKPDRTIEGCGSFYFLRNGMDIRILSFIPDSNYSGELIIPREVTTLHQIDVLSKAVSVAFESGSNVTTIEGVTSNSIFGEKLNGVDFSNATKLKIIGNAAFRGCTNLTSIDLSGCNNLDTIDNHSFEKSGLKSILFPESVRIIGDEAFCYTFLENVDLMSLKNLVSIGKMAFNGGGDFKTARSISLEGLTKLETIGEKAFYDKQQNDGQISLKGCKGLQNIGDYAFVNEIESGTKGLSVDISGCSSLIDIGKFAFSGAIFDNDTPRVLKGENSGIGKIETSADNKKVLSISPTTFAVNLDTLRSIESVEIVSDRFCFDNGMLMDSKRTTIYRVILVDYLDVPKTVTYVYKDALYGWNLNSPISINSETGVDWIPQGAKNLVVGSDLVEIIQQLENNNYSFDIRASQDGKSITIGTELGFVYANPQIVFSGNSVTITMTYSGGYSGYDVLLSDGDNEYLNGQWTFDFDSNLELTIKARDRNGSETVSVTFDPNGGTIDDASTRTIQITKGLTIIDSDLVTPYRSMYAFDGWRLPDAQEDYDFDSQLTSDIKLIAQWTYIGATVVFDSIYGKIDAVSNGNAFESGDVLSKGTVVLTFYPYVGYAFESWNVGTEKFYSTTLTLSAPDSDLVVSVNVSSYSADALKSIVLDNPSIDQKKYSLSWKFGGKVDTSMSNWSGHPSNPVIADDHVYVRIGPTIYQLSLETGMITNTVGSVNQTDFYHHLGYGNGMLIDYANGKVYDSELKHLFTLGGGTISFAYYVDGMFVCMLDGVPAAYNASETGPVDREPIWRSAETGWFKLYGTVSSPVFYDGYMYIICVDGKNISIKSIMLSDGTLKDSTGVLSDIRGHYLDDGWISIYDGTLYLTSYAYGLFGSVSADLKTSMITSIKVDSGEFIDDSLKYTKIDGYSSLTSQFVVFNGRGYVYSCVFGANNSALMVYDVSDMSLIRTVTTSTYNTSVPSHGSIVVDASQANKENNYAVKIYVVSYNNGTLYEFEDDCKKTNNSSGKKTVLSSGTYCSQAVRFGQNGEMIWYDDSGYIWCYSSSVQRYLFISDGNDAEWHSSAGKTSADALSSLGTDVVVIDKKTKTVTSANGKTGAWQLYVLIYDDAKKQYMWKAYENLMDSSLDICHYFALSQGPLPEDGSTYTYADGDVNRVYQFSTGEVSSDIVGKKLIASSDVVRIKFTDPSGFMKDSTYLVAKNQPFLIDYPAVSRPGYSATWLDGSVPAPKGEVSYSSDKTFTLEWVEISYSINVETQESSGKVYCDAAVTRSSGTKDLSDLKLVVIVEYSDAKYLNFYLDIEKTDGTDALEFAVGSDGIERIYLCVAVGKIVGEFDRYGETSVSFTE